MTRAFLLLTFVPALLASCTDPVQDKAIAALGPERGPADENHRPGQPCVVCHSEFGTASGVFSVAGTVFQNSSSPQGAPGVTVQILSADNSARQVTTKASGNFFLRKDEWDPAFPLKVYIYKDGIGYVRMQSHIGREPSCAGCHFNPPDAGIGSDGRPLVHYTAFQAVGQIYLTK